MTDRRSFLLGGMAAGLMAGCRAESALTGAGRSYSVTLIGDTHFDSPDPEHYHKAYVGDTSVGRFKAHKAEHVRNAEMWRERMPNLLKAAGRCRRSDTAFMLQLGDLVQGDCGDGAMHRQMLEDAVAAVKRAIPEVPFVTVCGNHDIRGTGAQLAYNRYMPGVISRELGVPVDRTTFSFRQGPDVFVVADFNVKETVEPGEDYERILRLLDESRDARYTFVASHGPFISTTRWSLLGHRRSDERRRELTRILAARNAIVLAGHTHVMEYDGCKFPEGRILQAVVNSVWSPKRPDSLLLVHDKPEQFDADIRKLPKASKKRADLLVFVEDRVRALRRFWRSSAAGHAQLEVSDDGVWISYFVGTSAEPSRRERLG